MRIYSQTYSKFIIVLAISCFFSCENHVEEIEMQALVEKENEGDPEPEAVPSYQTDVKPIFTNNCLGCHGNGGRFPNVSTYESIKLNANNIKSQVVSRSMPQGGSLTNIEIQTIKDWIENGTLNN